MEIKRKQRVYRREKRQNVADRRAEELRARRTPKKYLKNHRVCYRVAIGNDDGCESYGGYCFMYELENIRFN